MWRKARAWEQDMTDMPPANRAERRARARPPKGTKTIFRQAANPDSLAARRQREALSQSMPPAVDIGISNGYGAADIPPDNMTGDAADDGAQSKTFQGYRGKYGLLKTNIVTSYATIGLMLGGPSSADGVLFLSSAEPIADAWIAWGKADPRYMRIVSVLWGGPFMTLMLAHAPLIGGVMANHGVHFPKFLNPLQMPMFKAAQNAAIPGMVNRTAGQQGEPEPPADPFMAAYRPVGAMAPTEDAGPPPGVDMEAPLRVYPDEGIPADVETKLRELARSLGVPYAQLRDQYILETAQDRIAQNQHINQPGALGVPVTHPGA